MDLVIVRGEGYIVSEVVHGLFMKGYKIIVLEIEKLSTY